MELPKKTLLGFEDWDDKDLIVFDCGKMCRNALKILSILMKTLFKTFIHYNDQIQEVR